MMKTLAFALLCLAGSSLFGWGAGHDDHARLVLNHLPQEITKQWNAEQTKSLTAHWSHYPDGHRKLKDDRELIKILSGEELAFLQAAGLETQYFFHHSCGKAAAFYLLVKAFRAKNPDASAFYAGTLLHSVADAAAFNHGPLIHHYTYTNYRHVKSPLNPAMLDLSYMRKSPELQRMIEERLKGFIAKPSGKMLKDTLLDVMLSADTSATYMCSIEHKLAMPPPKCLEGMAAIADWQTREGAGWIVQAWKLAGSNAELDLKPELFSKKGELIRESHRRKAGQAPRDPALDGVYDGLFVPVKNPAVGVVCEPTAAMNSAWLGFGARFLSAVCARSIRRSGRNARMIPLASLKTETLNPEQIPVLIVCASNAVPKFAENTIRKYLNDGGKLIYIGGRADAKLTGMHKQFVRRKNNELAVSSKYGKDNENIYGKMAVVSAKTGKRFRFKDNPNCPAGWNKPFSDVSIRPGNGIVPLFDLDNGTERFCVAASNGKAVWLPQYLLMPFLFSEDRAMRDWAHPELDSFGADVLKTALLSLENSK